MNVMHCSTLSNVTWFWWYLPWLPIAAFSMPLLKCWFDSIEQQILRAYDLSVTLSLLKEYIWSSKTGKPWRLFQGCERLLHCVTQGAFFMVSIYTHQCGLSDKRVNSHVLIHKYVLSVLIYRTSMYKMEKSLKIHVFNYTEWWEKEEARQGQS